MSHKKFLIISIILIFLIFSMSLLFTFLVSNRKIKLGFTNLLESTETETNLVSAIEKLISGKNEIIVEITENDVCYWIRPTRDGEDYILEIKKYQSTTGKCIGPVLDESHIILEHGINIMGETDCLCSGDKYLLERVVGERRVDLRVIKR